MMVGQFDEPVIVAIEPLLEDRQHQNAPKVHARAAGILASLGIDFSGKQRKHLLAQLRGHIQVLQPESAALECRRAISD